MCLSEDFNELAAVLIGFVNGLYGEIVPHEVFVRNAINALKENDIEKIKSSVSIINYLKDESFPNCKSCLNPCGRTSNYDINSLDEIIRDNKIQLLNDFLSRYNDNMKLDEVSYNLSKISW